MSITPLNNDDLFNFDDVAVTNDAVNLDKNQERTEEIPLIEVFNGEGNQESSGLLQLGILIESCAKELDAGIPVTKLQIEDANNKTPEQLKNAKAKNLLLFYKNYSDGRKEYILDSHRQEQIDRQASLGVSIKGVEHFKSDGTIERVDAKFTLRAMTRFESQTYLQQAYNQLLMAADQLRRIRQEQIDQEHKDMMLAQKNLESPHPKAKDSQVNDKKLIDIIKDQKREPLTNISSSQVKQERKAAQEEAHVKEAKTKALEQELDAKAEKIQQKATIHEQKGASVKEEDMHESQIQAQVSKSDVNRANKTSTENELVTKPNHDKKGTHTDALPVIVQRVNPLRRYIP